jgi:hypothetical protein
MCTSAAHSTVTFEGETFVTDVGKFSTFNILAADSKGDRCTSGGDQFFWARLETMGSAAPFFNVDLRDNGQGAYQGSFRAMVPGTYTLVVSWEGKRLKGTPVPVRVRPIPGLHVSAQKQKRLKTCPVGRVDTGIGNNGGGYWETSQQWRRDDCDVPLISQTAALQCLQHKTILFVGDSLNRCAYWTFASWLAGLGPKKQAEMKDAKDYGEDIIMEEGTVHYTALYTIQMAIIMNEGTVHYTALYTILMEIIMDEGRSGGFLLQATQSFESSGYTLSLNPPTMKRQVEQGTHFNGFMNGYAELIPRYNVTLLVSV